MFKVLNTKYFLIPFSLIIVLSGYIYINFYSFSRAEQGYLDLVYKDETVSIQVDSTEYIVKAKDSTSSKHLVFVSGGLVEERAYLYNLASIAKLNNLTVHIPKVAFKLAIIDQGVIDKVVKKNGLTNYFVAGHSLGGVIACYHTKQNQEAVKGLILMGSYCEESISEYKGQVLSIAGSEDKVMDSKRRDEKNAGLPTQAIIETIIGANHAQFGNYGKQNGDGIATATEPETLTNILTQFARIQ